VTSSVLSDSAPELEYADVERAFPLYPLFGTLGVGVYPMDAVEYMAFPLALPSILMESAEFRGVTLFGNLNTNVATHAAVSFSLQLDDKTIAIELEQVHWTESVYALYEGQLCEYAISVFAGHYSGKGRGNLDIKTVQVGDTIGYFAAVDYREPRGNVIPGEEHGASIYWLADDIVFTLRVFTPVSQETSFTLEMMVAIAESVGQ
jgi:hypothetical protein